MPITAFIGAGTPPPVIEKQTIIRRIFMPSKPVFVAPPPPPQYEAVSAPEIPTVVAETPVVVQQIESPIPSTRWKRVWKAFCVFPGRVWVRIRIFVLGGKDATD